MTEKIYCLRCNCVQDCMLRQRLGWIMWYCVVCRSLVDEDWDNEMDEYNEVGM